MVHLDIVGFIANNSNLTTQEQTDFLNDYCEGRGYQEIVVDKNENGIPNPQSKKDFMNMMILRGWKQEIDAYRKIKEQQAVMYAPLPDITPKQEMV